MDINRVIWVILDSVGIGEMPDSKDFGDEGVNTICHVDEYVSGLNIPNMKKLGLGNIDGVTQFGLTENLIGAYAKCAEISNGKDTTIGHWEMVGIHSKEPFPTYPNGFPKEIINKFIEKANVPGILGNCTASGTEIIKEYGKEHKATKKPIVYTSADSVFQIACDEDVYSIEQLYDMCRIARDILVDEHAVARVIARPFVETDSVYERTSNRRDFSIKPDENNLLVKLCKSNFEVVGIGKIEDIFANVGITKAIHTKDNLEGMKVTLECMSNVEKGLIFTNLVEFDSKWGHRNDALGYAKGLEEFDEFFLPQVFKVMKDDDLLIIGADHGCDPTTKGTDHTREYTPLLIYGNNIKANVNLGIRETFADVGQTIAEIFEVEQLPIGKSFLKEIMKGRIKNEDV